MCPNHCLTATIKNICDDGSSLHWGMKVKVAGALV